MTEAHDTIANGLKSYAIGSKLRRLRLRKSMGLLELSKHTKLSPGMLSKLERDIMHPTLPTLLRIALVFSVGLEFFFSGSREKPLLAVVRQKERVALPDQPGTRDIAYRFESLDYPATERRFNSYCAEFFPVAPERLRHHTHPGVEFIYALHGTLSVHIGEEEHTLRAGDSMYFDATVSHAYRRSGGRSCRAIVVTAP